MRKEKIISRKAFNFVQRAVAHFPGMNGGLTSRSSFFCKTLIKAGDLFLL